MNELFLYLYLGDITEKVEIICIVGEITFIGVILFYLIVHDDSVISEELKNKLSQAAKTAKWIVLFFFILGVLMPSKFYFYTLAGAKTGEVAIQSELGKKALEALNLYLDEYIKGIKDEKGFK